MYRGKIDLNLYIEFNGEKPPSKINNSVVKSYMSQIEELGSITKSEKIGLALRLPDTILSYKESLNDEEKKNIFILINSVINDIQEFRKQEGDELEKDINYRLDLIKNNLENICKLDPERNRAIDEKIRNSFDIHKLKVDENRFEQELIFYLEKFDFTEEKIRLQNHLKYFKQVMSKDLPKVKKLNFISQEIGREINTIGSKANHSEIQKEVVQMKDELEKIKEQLLNVI